MPRILSQGDQITVSASQQIRVNGDDAWVKCEATHQLKAGEDTEEAWDKIYIELGQQIIKAIEAHANNIIEYSNKDNK